MRSYFDDLLDLDIPELQKAEAITPGTIASGPFAVVHNGIRGLGAHLHQYLDLVAFLDSSVYRTLTEDYEYTIDNDKKSIRFYYEDIDSEFIIEPIVEKDIELFYEGKNFNGLDEFLGFLEKLSQQITYGPQVEVTPHAITVDDTGLVKGLFKRTDSEFYRRENKDWTKLTPSDEDWADIEGLSWLNVLIGAVSLYDNIQLNSDTLQVDQFDRYIVG